MGVDRIFQIWAPEGLERFLIFLAIAIAWFLLVRREWMLVAAVAIYTAFAVGVVPLVAAAFFLAACYALGSMLVPKGAAVALLTGLSLYILIAGVLAHFPVNYPLLYVILLAAPIAIRRRNLRFQLPRFESRMAAVALIPILAHWLVVLKPEVSPDALSMHLVVPTYIAQHHQWSFDFHHWVWAVMPMGGVWGYTIAYLLGGEFAARLVNFGLFCTICALVYQCAQRWVSRDTALLLVGLFASTPMVQLVTGSLFIETFYAALILGALAAMWDSRWTIAALLLASALAVKFTTLFFVAPAAIILVLKVPRRQLVTVIAIFLVVAPLPYAYAWAKTGNPVFPFYNNVFHSPWFDRVDSPDPRFSEPLTWHTPFDVTFHTSRYWEGQTGSAGFQFLFLVPFVLLAVRRNWGFAEWSLIGIAFGATLLGLALKPNIRYLYPAVPLLTLVIALPLRMAGQGAGRGPGGPPHYAAFAVLVLNLAFLPSSSFWHKGFCLNPFDRNATQKYLETTAPVRLLVDRLNRDYPGENALFLETDDIAGLRGVAYSNGWHDREFIERVTACNAPEDVRELFDVLHLRRFIYPLRQPVREAQVQQFLKISAHADGIAGDFVLAHSEPGNPTVVSAGVGHYDDFDDRVLYFAHWSHDPQFAEPANHSVTYSDVPAASFEFQFQGTAITWVYTKAPNRGSANVSIDGTPRGEVDLYSPETRWQSRTTFGGLPPGEHRLIVISVGKPGRYIDLDELIVE